MGFRGAATYLCVTCVICSLTQSAGRFIIEQGGLKIKFPQSAQDQHPNGFDMSLANFGAPKYGGELLGKLVYVDNNHGYNHDCTPECQYACQSFADARPPFQLNSQLDPSHPEDRTNYIMLVDRGPIREDMPACKFAEKVWNAQSAGAQAVIVVNYEDRLTTMEAPDDQDEASYRYLRNITIPAAFITKSDGQALKDYMAQDGAAGEVYAVLDWNDVLPRAEKVHWEFWTNSNDQCGPVCDTQRDFIREFVPVAKELEKNFTVFTPHYIVWVCPPMYRDSQECRTQCIHNGRYCTPDPDGDLMEGFSGSDIVQENLRQLCVFKLGNDSGMPWVWWDYVTKFADECKMSEHNYNEECAERVFNELNGNQWSSVDKLRACIGDIGADTENAIMEAEMKSQKGDASTGEVYILPTIRINDAQYRGKLAYTEVLRAICASFNKDEEPEVCLRVSEDDCRAGSVGDATCKARTDGMTQCQNTFAGYQCTCGAGFIPHTNADGKEVCLNINECTSTQAADLDPKCTCERCACQDTIGGYECIENIKDECADNQGGCWTGEFTVKGTKKTFSACQDNLKFYKETAAKGKSLDNVPLHLCMCPPCFTEFQAANGQMECKPKCNLDYCDEPTGICHEETAGATAGTPGWAVVIIVFACLGVVGAVGYAAYRLRIRSAMHQEIRAIMAQYMPLENQEGVENGHMDEPKNSGAHV